MVTRKTIVVSGGFDPIHIGHLRMMEEAATYGDLIVVANSDEWLTRKKGAPFMRWEDRAEIIKGFRCVKDVVRVDDADGTVCEALRRLKPAYFANGGDRTSKNTPEEGLCFELGIQPLYNIGHGGKVRSSSDLVKASLEAQAFKKNA